MSAQTRRLARAGAVGPESALALVRAGMCVGNDQAHLPGGSGYRAALFGARKSDPVEARACARFALSERLRGLWG